MKTFISVVFDINQISSKCFAIVGMVSDITSYIKSRHPFNEWALEGMTEYMEKWASLTDYQKIGLSSDRVFESLNFTSKNVL